MTEHDDTRGPGRTRVPALVVFGVFLQLGLTSFGGPVAHIGYFRRAFVEQRGWLTAADFDDLVALCNFLPGPASSQAGFAIGMRLAGTLGGLAAFAGFTAPSAALMLAAASGLANLNAQALAPWLHGLKLVAVSVVAHAVIMMARTQLKDGPRIALALIALGAVLSTPTPLTAPLVILVAGLSGLLRARRSAAPAAASRSPGTTPLLAAFVALLVVLPLLAAATQAPALIVADGFFRAGSLVFGGGHVVLPLLQAESARWLSPEAFLAGYGAAQALPGPLFSFAAYLGAFAGEPAPDMFLGMVGLATLFLPGLLLVAAADPHWRRLRAQPRAAGFVAYASAAVVGVLAAAWWSPVATSAIRSPADVALTLIALLVLLHPKTPTLPVIAALTAAGAGAFAG